MILSTFTLATGHFRTHYTRLMDFLYKWNLDPAVMLLCGITLAFLALSVAGFVGGR